MSAAWDLGGQAGQPAPQPPWPDPQPLGGALRPVEPFLLEFLPHAFRPLVADISQRMQIPLDYAGANIIVALAGAVNRRARIQPKARDTTWVVVPNLWSATVAPPGFLKSPLMKAVLQLLYGIQHEWLQEYKEAKKQFELAKEQFGVQISAWKARSKQAYMKNQSPPPRPEHEPEEPILRRLIVNDTTFEALHKALSQNPAGVLVAHDELTSWLSQLDREGRQGEKGFFLTAWNGDSSYIIDRIGRGVVHVEACCLSMVGGIQPARLQSYLATALQNPANDDGLIQRFQLLAWPDFPPECEYVDREPDTSAQEQAATVFRRLVEWDASNPPCFRFCRDGQDLFEEWATALERKIRGGGLHRAFVSHLSKYRSLMPSLALLYELADRVAANLAPAPYVVSLEHAQQAAAYVSYLESHAQRLYSCVAAPEVRAAAELGEKIRTGKLVGPGEFFVLRDIYNKGWSGLDNSEAAMMAVKVLLDADWLREHLIGPTPQGGRPSVRYEVNPKVFQL